MGDLCSSMAAKLEQALLPSASDSPGARILRKMGWRPGQGVGPRLTLAQRRVQDRQLGLTSDATGDMDIEDADEAAKHTYAPRDTPVIASVRKSDSHGIGYRAGLGLHQQVTGGAGTSGGPQISGMSTESSESSCLT
jgi:G patch domain-containing protein 1